MTRQHCLYYVLEWLVKAKSQSGYHYRLALS